MIEAIIYESNTGFTEKYAQMLSKKLNLPSCPAGKMKKNLLSRYRSHLHGMDL